MSTKQAKNSGCANKSKFNTETQRRKSGGSDGVAEFVCILSNPFIM